MLVLGEVRPGSRLVHLAYLVVLSLVGWWLAVWRLGKRMEVVSGPRDRGRAPGPPPAPHTTGWEIVRRNFTVYRAELAGVPDRLPRAGALPLLDRHRRRPAGPGFDFNGQVVSYAAFVAPGMLAASAMNGAILDSTFGIFFKLRYDKVYEGVLATPMRTVDIARGELAWSLMRSAVYPRASWW